MFLTETAGKWGAGVEPVLPANAGSAPAKSGATVGLVSCASPGNCSAVGTYADSSGNPEGLLLTETDGSWSPGVEAVLPANSLSANQLLQWGSLSCASAGNCTAVGSYSSTGSFFQALLLTETDWIWSTGTDPVPTYSFAWLSSVSCASAGNCTAVGGYTDDSRVGQALLLTETAGSWGPPVAVNLPADYTHSDLATELDSVSCASAGNCTAVGSYDVGEVEVGHDESEERGKGLLLTETAGSWATGVEATMPADAVGPDGVGESAPQVSCPTAGNCSVVLEYYDNNKHVHGLLLSQTAGSWGAGHESPAGRFGNSISCASPGNCGVLVGGNLLRETGGSWGSEVKTPVPANGAGGVLYSVNCASAENCTAVGEYKEGAGHRDGLLVGGSPASIKLDIATGGTGSGSVSSTPRGIDCVSTCSASFHAGTPLTLTGAPSAGSRFSGWSGGGCKGTGKCHVDTGISEQTVTANFTQLPACVVPNVKGKRSKAAEGAIRAHNCAVGKVKRADSRKVEKGRVVSQKPGSGRRLKHGAKVSLVVSQGRR
jgi:PASTA domain/Divergent InlB B-repeat domain